MIPEALKYLKENPLILVVIILVVLVVVYRRRVAKDLKKSTFTTYASLSNNDKKAVWLMNTDPVLEQYYMTDVAGFMLTDEVVSSQTERNLQRLYLPEENGGGGIDDEDIGAAVQTPTPSQTDEKLTNLLVASAFPSALLPAIEARLKSLTRTFRYISFRMMLIQAQDTITAGQMSEVEDYYKFCRTVLVGHMNEDSVESQKGAVAVTEMFGLWANRLYFNGKWYQFDVKSLGPYVNLPKTLSSLIFTCSGVESTCGPDTMRMCDVMSYQLPTQLFDMAALSENPDLALETTSTYQKCSATTLYGWYVLVYNYIGTLRTDYYNQRYRDYTRTLGGIGSKLPIISWHWGPKGPFTKTRWVDIGKRCYHKDVINPRNDGNNNPIPYVPKWDISYDRGVGKVPSDNVVWKGCGSGKKKLGAFCYYNNVNGGELFYTRGQKCKWKKGRLTCPYNPPRDGYSCDRETCNAIKSNPDQCPDGYESTGPQTCERVNKCSGDMEYQAGLCYKKCRDGYKGNLTMCNADKPTATCTRRPDAYRLAWGSCVPRVLNKDSRGKQLYKCPRKKNFDSIVKTYNKDLTVPYPTNPYEDPEPLPENQQPANREGSASEAPMDDSMVGQMDNDPNAAGEVLMDMFSTKFMSKFA
jgi:hypothetical protein